MEATEDTEQKLSYSFKGQRCMWINQMSQWYNISVIGCGNIDCEPTMIRSNAVLPPCCVSKVHGNDSDPKAAAVSSVLFIILNCFSLPAPLWWNDLLSLRAASLLLFQAENSTFYDVPHIITQILASRLPPHKSPDRLTCRCCRWMLACWSLETRQLTAQREWWDGIHDCG